MVCFDLSGFSGLNCFTRQEYLTNWAVFDRVQAYNSNVSTLRAGGDKTRTYYIFRDTEERAQFTWGQALHVKRYPNSNWNSVSLD
jgi:hypothetical protein